MDLVLASAVLVLGAPVIAAAALAVRLSSRGPVIFRQQRVGLNGQPFTLYKFRTMRAGSSEDPHREYVRSMISRPERAERRGVSYKLNGDDRVTPVGRLLRRTSLDELPQLWNVLRGEMSMVGPRPPLDYEVELYEPWQLQRLTVRPGLTGLWQVSGRNNMAYVDMCMLDVQYVREWTLAGDVRIAVRTPWVMLFNSGRAS